MNTISVHDRMSRNTILERFCEIKDMFFETIDKHPHIVAQLFTKDKKFCGFAGIHLDNCKFGSKPVVATNKDSVVFLYELGGLVGASSALVVRFRNKIAYWRIEKPESLTVDGKKIHIPINLFKIL